MVSHGSEQCLVLVLSNHLPLRYIRLVICLCLCMILPTRVPFSDTCQSGRSSEETRVLRHMGQFILGQGKCRGKCLETLGALTYVNQVNELGP